jgi:hypothetical protein
MPLELVSDVVTANAAPAPIAGAVHVTVAPDTGKPALSVTSTATGLANEVLTRALWPAPADTLKLATGSGAAACVTMNVTPPTFRLALRDEPVFAATLYVMDPLPVPLLDETVSHEALLATLHAQLAPALSVVVPLPPAAAKLALAGLKLNEQPVAWLSVKFWPPMDRLALRAGPALAATE